MSHTLTITTVDTTTHQQGSTAAEALRERVERLKTMGTKYTLTGNTLTFTQRGIDVTLTYEDN